MFTIKLLVVSITIIFILAWSYRHLIRPSIERRRILAKHYTPHVRHCHQAFNNLYRFSNTAGVARAARKALGRDDYSLTYGEIDFVSFVSLFKLVEPNENDVFYDLGCGAGKAVFAVALTFELQKCVGVELLTPLFELCRRQLTSFDQLIAQDDYFTDHSYQITFFNDDLLNVDMSDASIVFINATGFFGELWESIVNKLLQLPQGCRIILTSKKLPEDAFHLLDESMRLMSWGMNSLRIYRKLA